jgi:exonuclease SbcC
MKQLQVVTEKDSLAEELTKIVSQFTLSDPVQEEERLRNMLKNCQQALHQDTNQQAALSAFMLEKSNVQQKMLLDQGVLTLSFQSATVMLNAAMEENAFGSISELKLALSLSNHAQIKQQQDAEAQQYQQLKGALHAAQLKLETLMLKGLPEEDLYGLMLAQNELENTQTVYYQEIGSVNEQLRKNEIEILQNQQKIAVIKNKESVFHQWQQLNGLIGSKSGDSFKKFAQDFTLTLLIQHANRHLKVMYNRYELYKKDDSTEMELQIKDKNFFDDVRNINSLSGGETFLVSLSLALGLSDLASKKTKIRSLFIDEGFGTLDPENLNNALDALELLRQTDDRQIGIISHVEELKKRIHTQIQVNKVTAEFSEIMIVD